MATKKLSEALAELQAAASVSGLDVRLVVAGQTDTDNAQTITLQQLLTAMNVPTATANNDGLMSAADKQLLEQIKTKLGL